jgi:hypothetical protein
MSRAAEVDELLDLFDMMWKDALTLLGDLNEGIAAYGGTAYLTLVMGVLLLLMASFLVARGLVTSADIPSLLLATGIVVWAGLMFRQAWVLWRRFTFLRTKYSEMIRAARKFKQQGKMAA